MASFTPVQLHTNQISIVMEKYKKFSILTIVIVVHFDYFNKFFTKNSVLPQRYPKFCEKYRQFADGVLIQLDIA